MLATLLRLPLLLAVLVSAAWAQTTPRVLVIFDTSGSMLWDYIGENDCRGDGSADFPHTNPACQVGSRMFHAKQALAGIVQQTNGVEFGLMRYGQLEPGDAGFGRVQQQVGAQYRDGANTILDINYDGSSNGCGPADRLVDPGPGSRAEVLGWLDGSERYPADKELRANGYTPLTMSMQSAREALAQIIADDPEVDCRPYYVLLLTDGYQQCPGEDAANAAYRAQVANELVGIAEDLRALRVQGQRVDVRTFVVGFGPGTAFATELDELARAGGTAVDANGRPDLLNGTAYQANDPQGLVANLAAAVGNARPRELCDGEDNDCDGRVDEDFPQLGRVCTVGSGACTRDGVIVCAPDGNGAVCSVGPGDAGVEGCNGRDDDCDGQVDEGVRNRCGDCGPEPGEICNGDDDDCDGAVDEGTENACGECGRLPQEVCNGRDDDCDGRTDEGTLNACGECGQAPVEVCNPGNECVDDDCDNRIDEGLNCPACNCQPQVEQCNGRDDDCDNEIDEGVLNRCGQCGAEPAEICNGLDDDCDGSLDEAFPEAGQRCGEAIGVCTQGNFRCVSGALVCGGGNAPSQEVCDDLDNDCDGQVDEGAANACGWCGPPRIEVCDNIDNNCDGNTDTGGDLCRQPASCVNGECAPPCENGECFNGRICVNQVCVTPCRNTECPDGWVCQDGTCNDPCVGIPCDDGTYCSLGRCLPTDCFDPANPCPADQFCADGRCVRDPCADATCAAGQGCIDGRCIDACANVRCTDGTLCYNGECVRDPCARVSCPFPSTCVEGRCTDDPCFEVDCDVGFICAGGRCLEDPCHRVTCPGGALCHRGRCADPGSGQGATTDPGDPTPPGAAAPDMGMGQPRVADEGCYCDASPRGRPGSGAWLALFGLLALGLRRRRLP